MSLTKVENKRNISVDIGNTRIKTGLFEHSKLIESQNFLNLAELAKYCLATPHDKLGLISVGKSKNEILQILGVFKPLLITIDSSLPIKMEYKTPETLGIDRVVAAIGASSQHPNKNILVVDMGSCITYDLVDANNTYLGGIISPGLQMRMQAMATFTQNLPDIRNEWENHQGESLGKSTKECLARGSYQAIIHEIDGFMEEFRREYAQLTVILTGGDAFNFESKVKQPIFADSFLVLKGIDKILSKE
ncbi:MAG: type III pantothenate kinase [Cyclobacteriaceae bacterium]|jgi:type III pantothenate kinase